MVVSEYKKKWVEEHREQVNATARRNQKAARDKNKEVKEEQIRMAKEDEPIQIKICSSCGYIGPEKDFRFGATQCMICRNIRRKDWRDPDKQSVINRVYYQENKERIDVKNKEWQKANPEAFAEYKRRRRMRKSGNGGSFTRQEWQALKAQYNYSCLCCSKRELEIKLEADHVIPVSKGGNGFITNIQPLCGPCNNSKHIKETDYRLTYQAMEV